MEWLRFVHHWLETPDHALLQVYAPLVAPLRMCEMGKLELGERA